MQEINILNANFNNVIKSLIETEVKHSLQAYMSKMQEKDEWLTPKEAQNYLKVSAPTLCKYATNGLIHKHYLGDLPRYRKSEVDKAFIKLLSKKGGYND